jgi:hypothetical protein
VLSPPSGSSGSSGYASQACGLLRLRAGVRVAGTRSCSRSGLKSAMRRAGESGDTPGHPPERRQHGDGPHCRRQRGGGSGGGSSSSSSSSSTVTEDSSVSQKE